MGIIFTCDPIGVTEEGMMVICPWDLLPFVVIAVILGFSALVYWVTLMHRWNTGIWDHVKR
jgi:hypothetical protein